jgi:hypothetical protein
VDGPLTRQAGSPTSGKQIRLLAPPWRAADDKQSLLLTVDDHSRRYLKATFVPTGTIWHHFEHFRRAFLRHGRQVALYTDGLALFGYQYSTDGGDPRSELQRALTAFGAAHPGAASPQAISKIERRFGTGVQPTN